MDWQKYIKYGPNYKNMKEEKRDYCLRMLGKLRKAMTEFQNGAMHDSAMWIDGLISKLPNEHKDYMLPRDIRIECNELWKEVQMRINY